MENRFACPKLWFDVLFFWSLRVMLMNIAICMWGLKSALLVKNAWFHNSSVITILTHSNKGLPAQLHKWGVISKGGHAHVAFCIQATHLISPPSHYTSLHRFFLWLFLNVTWVENCSWITPLCSPVWKRPKLVEVVKLEVSRWRVDVLHQYQVMSLCVLTPSSYDLPSIPFFFHSFHFHEDP